MGNWGETYALLIEVIFTPCITVFGPTWLRPPKIEMEPKSEGFEDDSPFQMGDFQVPCYK